ncbi:MAG: hypothetical protein HYU66_06055 [Armatimonadetes bacterium]|nr:hypothetical protein [Armatimonadota bacterium]
MQNARWWLAGSLLLALASACAAETREEGVIPPGGMAPENGFCYTVSIQTPSPPDSNAGAQASYLRLFEDAVELGPPHCTHQTIRDDGGGVFSHWWGAALAEYKGTATLYFSTSDNSDPRTNGRTYRWVVIRDDAGKPIPAQVGTPPAEPCRLAAVPGQALVRDRHTTLLADFDATDSNDAGYARVERREVGVGNQPDAPGRFGNGVAVEGTAGTVMYPGLDNYNPRTGNVEFWAQSRAAEPIWNDGKEHWLLVLYPERAGTSARYGTAPYFVALRKTTGNQLDFRLVNQSMPPYAAAVSLREGKGWSVRLPTERLAPAEWHHLLLSWDLRGQGRMWLMVDGEGARTRFKLPATAPAPNPGGFVLLGGLWGLPGDGVETSDCNLDDLRIQDTTVEARLEGAAAAHGAAVDEARLMLEEDLARAMLDRLIALQFHGGWGAGYHWPTYTPTGWSFIGRGVDMWFSHSAFAGQALLRGWMLWGDDRYLDAAIEAADMFCRTQMPNGSWAYHYTYSRGQFEPWGESAYIAQAMQSNQIRFLSLMSRLLGYERYGQAIRKSGDWMASIQFPSGAWGWEAYPFTQQGPYGHPALNDSVTPQAMSDLFVIWCATADRKYLDPVLRGAQWIIDCQAGAPTFGWADQYDTENHFIWMRNFEPPAVSMQAINAATSGLCLAYDLTGDAKYLAPLNRVLAWLDAVPADQRGWLWYDPEKSVPVVAYYNEMLPVTDPKAIREMIPRLDAHYGTKFPWQADRIRRELKLRERGPVYPDARGWRARADFGDAPALSNAVAAFGADYAKAAREQLAAWAAGKPLGGIRGGGPEYGHTFEIGNAVSYCETLLSDLEMARVALGDLPPDRVPRYARGGASDWVYMEPQRDFYATPLSQPAP